MSRENGGVGEDLLGGKGRQREERIGRNRTGLKDTDGFREIVAERRDVVDG